MTNTPDHLTKPVTCLLYLDQAAVNTGCVRCDVLLDRTNKAAINLFKKLDAQNLTQAEDWHLFSMDSKAMEKLQAR